MLSVLAGWPAWLGRILRLQRQQQVVFFSLDARALQSQRTMPIAALFAADASRVLGT